MRLLKTFVIVFCLNTIGFSQNGKILSKVKVDLKQTSFWNTISERDSLLPDFSHLKKLEFYYITYISDSNIVHGIYSEPNLKGKYPVVIFNRGGNREFSKLTIETFVSYTSKLSAEGYIVIGSNYREKDEFGGSEINDVLILTETIKEIDKAKHNKIGMFGWSRGGIMTYLALQKSDLIKTAIVGNGPTDMFATIQERPEIETNVLLECVPNYLGNKKLELKKRSVVYWVNELNKKSSLLILCSKNDDRVNPKQAYLLSEKLKEINYNFKLIELNTDHFFSDKKNELSELVINWFNENLK